MELTEFSQALCLVCLYVSELGFGGLFTYVLNYMVNATVCESDTQVKSDKTAPAKQPYFSPLCAMLKFL